MVYWRRTKEFWCKKKYAETLLDTNILLNDINNHLSGFVKPDIYISIMQHRHQLHIVRVQVKWILIKKTEIGRFYNVYFILYIRSVWIKFPLSLKKNMRVFLWFRNIRVRIFFFNIFIHDINIVNTHAGKIMLMSVKPVFCPHQNKHFKDLALCLFAMYLWMCHVLPCL